ncbi:hypothetical protein ACOMHN_047362 [Nucella lapillus]
MGTHDYHKNGEHQSALSLVAGECYRLVKADLDGQSPSGAFGHYSCSIRLMIIPRPVANRANWETQKRNTQNHLASITKRAQALNHNGVLETGPEWLFVRRCCPTQATDTMCREEEVMFSLLHTFHRKTWSSAQFPLPKYQRPYVWEKEIVLSVQSVGERDSAVSTAAVCGRKR